MHWFYLSLDAVLVTLCLSVMMPVLYSVLMFVYLLQIISAGVISQYKGSFSQALLVGALFSGILALDPGSMDSSLVMSFLLGNLGFLVTAGLGGFFGVQAGKMNWFVQKADQSFSEIANLNRLIVNNIQMGLLIMDKNLLVSYANSTALDMLKLSSSFPVSVQSVLPDLKGFISSCEKRNTNHFKMHLNSRGAQQVVELFLSPFEVSDQEEQRWLALFHDSSQKYAQEQMDKKQEHFTAIGRIAGRIADRLSSLSALAGRNRSLTPIIEDLQYFAQLEENKDPVMSLLVNPILEDLQSRVQARSRWSHIHSHFELHSKAQVEGHHSRFLQLFWRLIENACEAMEGRQGESKLTVESFDDNEWVVVRVKDSGKGINSDLKEKMFIPGYSTKEQSLGLGLSIVDKLVSFYKGDMTVERPESGGAVFIIRFPISLNPVPGERVMKKSA